MTPLCKNNKSFSKPFQFENSELGSVLNLTNYDEIRKHLDQAPQGK